MFLFLLGVVCGTVAGQDLSTSTSGPTGGSCSPPWGECNFYPCFEEKMNCGSNGYFMGYAYPICSRYFEFYDLFNAAGQNFVNCTRQCLLDFIVPYYDTYPANGQNCSSIYTTAISSHYPCYVQCGFCTAVFGNIGAFCEATLPLSYEEKFQYIFGMAEQCLIDYGTEFFTDIVSLNLNDTLCDVCQLFVNGVQGLSLPDRLNPVTLQNLATTTCSNICVLFPSCWLALDLGVLPLLAPLLTLDAKTVCTNVGLCS